MAVGPSLLICLLAILAPARVFSNPTLGLLSNNSSFASRLNATNSNKFLLADELKHEFTARAEDDAWTLSVQRGAKLLQGMKSDDKAAATLYGLGETAESPYDGGLHDTLVSWGYNDNTESMQKKHDDECDMENGNKLKKYFDELGLGTKSKGQGGPNQCFQIEHFDSPAVILNEDGSRPEKANQDCKAPCGTIMRVTDAAHADGVNGIGRAVIAMNIVSPAKAAAGLWRRDPKPEELPHIRSFSDISWAFWNRAAAGNIGAPISKG